MKKLVWLILAIAIGAQAQTQVNPATQIRWPAVTGSGVPSSGCPVITTATVTSGTDTVIVASTVGLFPSEAVTGTGIPAGTTVTSVYGSAAILSANATASGSGVSLSFYPYGLPYTDLTHNTQYVCSTAGWTSSTGATGTVTSVAMTVPSDEAVSGSPITAAGTLAITRNSQPANFFLASPNGTSGVPSFRAIVAADIPTLNQSTTGNAATATALAATPTLCTSTQAATGILANGNATGCFTPSSSGTVNSAPQYSTPYYAGSGSSTVLEGTPNGLTGQGYVAANGAAPSWQSPGIGRGNGGADVTTTYTVQCDSSTALQDRGKVLHLNSSTAFTVTVPDPTTSGCGGNFYFGADNVGSATVTFTRTSTANFYVLNGGSAPTAVTSFTVNPSESIRLYSLDNANYQVVPGALPVTGGTVTGALNSTYSGNNTFAGSITSTFVGNGSGLTSLPTNTSLYPILNQNTTGTAANITATNNSTLTTLPALSLPYSQLTGVPATVADTTVAVSAGTQGANSCSTTTNVTMTNLATTMVVHAGYSANPATLTGWGSTGGMVFQIWPSAANTATWQVCNQTNASITYSAITFNIGAN